MFSKLFVFMAVAVVAVNAQTQIPTQALPPCVVGCLEGAALVDKCFLFTNKSCVCTSAEYVADARSCIDVNCASDLPTALSVQSSLCGATTPTTSATTTHSFPTLVNQNPTIGIGASSSASTTTLTSGSSATTASASSSGTSITGTTPSSSDSEFSSSAPIPTSSSDATLVASSGVAAVLAVIAGFLAI